MKFPVATKIVKTKDNGTATLTRESARVFATKGSSTVMDTTFPTVAEAKAIMGNTKII